MFFPGLFGFALKFSHAGIWPPPSALANFPEISLHINGSPPRGDRVAFQVRLSKQARSEEGGPRTCAGHCGDYGVHMYSNVGEWLKIGKFSLIRVDTTSHEHPVCISVFSECPLFVHPTSFESEVKYERTLSVLDK